MAPISQTHPSPIWHMGDAIQALCDKFGAHGPFADLFSLMGQTDLDKIRHVATSVWGTDGQHSGQVAGSLLAVQHDLSYAAHDATPSWTGDANKAFAGSMDNLAKFFGTAGQDACDVGETLKKFADDADVSIGDGVAAVTGLIGAVVGALAGLAAGAITGPGDPVAAVVGAIVGLIIGLAFAYFGTLLPKIANCLSDMTDLAGQEPPTFKE